MIYHIESFSFKKTINRTIRVFMWFDLIGWKPINLIVFHEKYLSVIRYVLGVYKMKMESHVMC